MSLLDSLLSGQINIYHLSRQQALDGLNEALERMSRQLDDPRYEEIVSQLTQQAASGNEGAGHP